MLCLVHDGLWVCHCLHLPPVMWSPHSSLCSSNFVPLCSSPSLAVSALGCTYKHQNVNEWRESWPYTWPKEMCCICCISFIHFPFFPPPPPPPFVCLGFFCLFIWYIRSKFISYIRFNLPPPQGDWEITCITDWENINVFPSLSSAMHRYTQGNCKFVFSLPLEDFRWQLK